MADPIPTSVVIRDGVRFTVNTADVLPDDQVIDPATEPASLAGPVGDEPEAGWAKATVAQLADAAEARGLKVPAGARKADLVKLLDAFDAEVGNPVAGEG